MRAVASHGSILYDGDIMEYIVVIIGFILGAVLFNWIATRNQRGDRQGQRPAWQPQRANLPPLAQAVLRYFPVTTAFIATCVVVALLSDLGRPGPVVSALQISDPFHRGLDDVLSGQVWRLITPIFLHFGFTHIFFNMFMLWDLGRLVEHLKGSKFVLQFTLAVGIASNLAQYLLTGSPFFGGMSGVLYGFFGYVWMQGKYNPRFGITLTQHTVVIMLGWFVLCWTGLLGPIANWAHTGGLLAGAGWGYYKRGSRR
jgi:rhomboid protease GlpG